MEAQAILRAEKGYIIVGKDTDGETMPQDLGFDAPLKRKTAPYVGDRGLRMPVAKASGRRQLVGLRVPDGMPRLPDGAHIVAEAEKGLRSDGFVTSSYDSASLGFPIAMASLRDGHARIGESVTVYHMGATMRATVVPTCFFDPTGERLHA
jgi:sarcosine oxidase subunit alpha